MVCVVLVFALLSATFVGCGGGNKENAEISNKEDIEWLKSYINQGSSSNPGFDHNDFERLDFATDNHGNKWALVMTKSYYKRDLSEGLFEAHVFEKVNEQWKRTGGGSGGYSSGVPLEVQKKWGIEGQ